MKSRRTVGVVIVTAAVAVAGTLTVAIDLWGRRVELAAGQPDRLPAWTLYARHAVKLAQSAGIDTSEPDGREVLEAFWLTSEEAHSAFSLRGLEPWMVVRSPMLGLTDTPADRSMLWCSVRLEPGSDEDPSLQIGGRQYRLDRLPGDTLGLWFSHELAARSATETGLRPNLPRASEAFPRVWKPQAPGGRRGIPNVKPLPLFQVDLFRYGSWSGTVALFKTKAEAEAAKLE